MTQGLNNNVTDLALTDNGIIFLINGNLKQEAYIFCLKNWSGKLSESEITEILSRY